MYSREELTSFNRRKLQNLCKQFSLKANKKNSELVDDLYLHFTKLKENDQLVMDVPKTVPTISDDSLKLDLLMEIEQRAKKKVSRSPKSAPAPKTTELVFPVSRIPKLAPAPKTTDLFSPGRFTKSHNETFTKMDSIDVYLEKRKKRAEEMTQQRNKSLHRRFHSKLNSPIPIRTSPRFQEKSNKTVLNDFMGRSAKKTKFSGSFKPSRLCTSARSFSFNSSSSKLANTTANEKTPLKFDLKASLQKPLTYQPHRGKLKQVYIAKDSCISIAKGGIGNPSVKQQMRIAAKDITKKPVTRVDRRKMVHTRRAIKKSDELAKRRGIMDGTFCK